MPSRSAIVPADNPLGPAQRRLSRQLIYAAEYGAMNELLAYLTENCCGRDTSCAPTACNPADNFIEGEPDEALPRARHGR
jgi:ArsR family transcriptional regulator, arsenate/arsenite/antimonite-responsive transcriptional repressor